MKTYKTTKHETWIQLIRLRRREGHVVEIDGVAGILTQVSGRWNWLRMEGHVTLKLHESDCTQLGCVSKHTTQVKGGGKGIA